ncbi:RNA polymerase sigma factor [Dactylosporangium sp. NPDC050688]|uniref:RNA polymerase sigma factor n=1 Tax=Dactylosporangium sp. NPDC050688 TaxID=3157217 RepID=UPI0033C2D40C
MSLGDTEIIGRSRTHPELFGALFERHSEALFRYACRRVGAEVAEDVVAETFLAAFRQRARYDLSRSDARPWLFGILVREVSRHRRKETSRLMALARAAEPDQVDGLADRVAEDLTARSSRARLAAALAGLHLRDRDVLTLIAWQEMSYEEVARVLGIPVGTVRSRLNRARRQMQQMLGTRELAGVFEEWA